MKHRIEIQITDEALAKARAEYPSTFPDGGPDEWDETQLRRAIDILDRYPSSDFEIVGYDAREETR